MLNNLKIKVNTKIKSNSGESISETLVALLISALALVMLAGAIGAASHMVISAREKLSQYYAANELVVNMDDSVSIDSSIAQKETNQTMKIKKDGKTVCSVIVTRYKNMVFEKNPVVSYREN